MNELQIIEHQNQRVLLTKQLAEVYETSETNIKTNFNRNKDRFIEGRDYYLLKGHELKEFLRVTNSNLQISSMTRSLYLWTERGAFLHAKSLNTDKAWEVYDSLIEHYFRTKKFEIQLDSYMIVDPIERAERWIEEEKERQNLRLANKEQEQRIQEMKPKADYCDSILKNEGLTTITAIAKDYGMSAPTMNKTLNQLGIQYKQGRQWFLYCPYQNKGYTQSQTFDISKNGNSSNVVTHTKWTQKGRLFLYEILKENGIIPTIERED